MTAQQQDWLDADDDVEDAVFEPVHVPGDGPHDVEDLDPEVTLGAGTVDFGAVRVPVPERGTVAVDPSEKGRMQAVHVSVPEGRLSVSALAAPKSSRLWPDLVKEIDASLREGGARVRSFQGDWGRELHATSGAATSLFVGVDGARWMLYGVATGPTRDAGALDEQLRRMMRGTIVVRGRSPYPVRTVLPLEVPEALAAAAAEAAVPQASGTVVELRTATDVTYRSAPTAAYPAEAAPAPPPAPSPAPLTTALPMVAPATTALPMVAPATTALPITAPPATSPAPASPALAAQPLAAQPLTAPPTTALPVAGPAVGRASGWSPAVDVPAAGVAPSRVSPPELSPPTTALPVHRGPANAPVDATPPTTALPVAPPRGPASWPDPVHRIGDPGGPRPLDPDDRPTDILPAATVAPPTERWPAVGAPGVGAPGAGAPGGSETAPWALDPPAPPGPGGRRRLREPGDHLPVSPGLTGPWAPWPDSPTGSGRAVGSAPRTDGREPPAFPAGPGALPPVPSGSGADAGRRRDAGPAPLPTGRRRVPDPAPTEALTVVPEVLRVGRHAVVEPPQGRPGRGAETQPWVAPRRDTTPGPATETAPWTAVPRAQLSQPRPSGYGAEDGPVTEPLPVQLPASERPTGRHHRPS